MVLNGRESLKLYSQVAISGRPTHRSLGHPAICYIVLHALQQGGSPSYTLGSRGTCDPLMNTGGVNFTTVASRGFVGTHEYRGPCMF